MNYKTAECVTGNDMQLQAPKSARRINGRRIRKLRISITDRCNARCMYCMPAGSSCTASAQLLPPTQIAYIAEGLTRLGIDEIRITGGEPTVRDDLSDIVRLLSRLPVSRMGITTNGIRLDRCLDWLRDSKCENINISLDSLRRRRFRHITGIDALRNVRQGITAALQEGFQVKVNMVVMRNINEDEILDFVAFANTHPVQVRFLEAMPVTDCFAVETNMLVGVREIMTTIRREYDITPEAAACDSTSVNYRTRKGGRIGFIASRTRPFCASCSRIRLDCIGHLRACLESATGMAICNRPWDEYPAILRRLLSDKPVMRRGNAIVSPQFIGG